MRSRELLERVGRLLARFSLGVSALLILAIMGVTVVEVIGRYFLNTPLHGKGDIIKLMLGAALFFAMPIVTVRREHICVDLLDGLTGARISRLRDFFVDLSLGGMMITLAYWVAQRVENFYNRGEVTELLFIPKYPLAFFIAFVLFASGFLLILTMLMRAWQRGT